MKTMTNSLLCTLVATSGAVLLTPVFISTGILNNFLVYSIFSAAENIFLLLACSLYLATSIAIIWRKEHRLAVSAAGLAFYCVAVQGFLVMGLASLAILWVIPMVVYQFNENKRAEAEAQAQAHSHQS
jgi:hypothetical protein